MKTFIIVAAQAADGYGDHELANGTVAVLQVSDSFIYLEQVGADTTGVIDAGGSLKAILDLGLQVRSKSSGIFNVATLSYEEYLAIDLQGPFTLVGNGSAGMFSSNENFRADNVTVTDTRYLIGNELSDAAQVLQIKRLHVTNSTFERCGWTVRVRTYAALAANKVGANVSIKRNKVKSCGSGFAVNAFIYGYEIARNDFETIGYTESLADDVICISIGQDNSSSSETLADNQGQGVIRNNTAEDINNPSATGITDYIQFFGSDNEVHGNVGKNLVGLGVDNEGIYLKGSRNKIYANSLIDCGSDEGAIKQKGVNSGNGIRSTKNFFFNNYISWTVTNDRNTGISSISGDNYIHDNTIVNAAGRAIDTVDAISAKVYNNKILNIKPSVTGSIEAILIQNTPNATIYDNEIEFDGGFNGDCYGVTLISSTVAFDKVSIKNNDFTLINEVATPTGTFRCIRVSDGGLGFNKLVMTGNGFNIQGANRTIFGMSLSISGTWSLGVVQNNINNMTSSGSVNDISTSTLPTTYQVDANVNFTSYKPIASSAQLNSQNNDINDTYKFQGREVWNTNADRPVYATGSVKTDVWNYSDGTLANTPI